MTAHALRRAPSSSAPAPAPDLTFNPFRAVHQPLVPQTPHPGLTFEPLSVTQAALLLQVIQNTEHHTADVDDALRCMEIVTLPGFPLSTLSYHQWGDVAAMVGGRLGAVLLKPVSRSDLHKEVRQRFLSDNSPSTIALHGDVALWAPGLMAYLQDVATESAYLPDRRDPDSLLYERYTLMPLLRAYCGGGVLGLRDAASWMSLRPYERKRCDLEKLYRAAARRDFAVAMDVLDRAPSWRDGRTMELPVGRGSAPPQVLARPSVRQNTRPLPQQSAPPPGTYGLVPPVMHASQGVHLMPPASGVSSQPEVWAAAPQPVLQAPFVAQTQAGAQLAPPRDSARMAAQLPERQVPAWAASDDQASSRLVQVFWSQATQQP